MSKLNDIKMPVKAEFKQFEKHFKKSISSKVPLLSTITDYLYRRKGKQIRPLLVILSARMHGEINDSTYTAASLIELLHTATLVHDDVIDHSNERRGIFSINALWRSKISVLVGDYLLAQGLLLSVKNNEYKLLEIVSQAVKEMSEGELLQLKKSRGLNFSETDYFTIIEKKTASLIAACTAAGTKSTNDNSADIEKMHQLGMYLGIAFQIKDDLFDYEKNNATGKPSGNDIQEKKLTLPLIYSLNKTNKSTRKQIVKLINSDKNTQADVKTIFDFVVAEGGISYAINTMQQYIDKTIALLNQFEPTEASQALKALIHYVIERKK